MGGLGLQNPFVSLLLSRQHVEETPEKLMDKYLEEEEFAYERAKARFNQGSRKNDDDSASESGGWTGRTTRWDKPGWRDAPEFENLRNEPFMSLDEFTRYRERTESRLGDTYRQLMRSPSPATVVPSGEVKVALPDWTDLDDYEKWVVQLYHKDMIARFGGADVVDKGLLPTGLMTMLRESRFRWQG